MARKACGLGAIGLNHHDIDGKVRQNLAGNQISQMSVVILAQTQQGKPVLVQLLKPGFKRHDGAIQKCQQFNLFGTTKCLKPIESTHTPGVMQRELDTSSGDRCQIMTVGHVAVPVEHLQDDIGDHGNTKNDEDVTDDVMVHQNFLPVCPLSVLQREENPESSPIPRLREGQFSFCNV